MEKYKSPSSKTESQQSDSTKKAAARYAPQTNSSNKQSAAKSESSIATLEEELMENPDLVYDPIKIRKMLLTKID